MLGPRIVRDLFAMRTPKRSEEKTLIISRDGATLLDSHERSIKPLIQAIGLLGPTPDCIIFDRTVGLAAAKLHLLLEPKAVYAHRMSKDAIALYREQDIEYHAECVVETIIENKRTCPLELLARRHETDELLEILAEFS